MEAIRGFLTELHCSSEINANIDKGNERSLKAKKERPRRKKKNWLVGKPASVPAKTNTEITLLGKKQGTFGRESTITRENWQEKAILN